MSELYETGEPTTQMVVEGERSEGERSETTEGDQRETTGVSEWQRSLGAEAPAEAPAPLPAEPASSEEDERSETTATEEVPTTPERRPSPVEPLAPLPAAPSSEEIQTEEEDEDERSEATDDDGGAVVQQLFVGPSDSIPLLDVERLGLRHREVGCSATPTMGPAASGELTEGEMSDLESDVGDVPNEAGRLAEVVGLDLVFTDEAMAEMARRMPLWLRIVGVTVCLLYLGLFIRSVRCM